MTIPIFFHVFADKTPTFSELTEIQSERRDLEVALQFPRKNGEIKLLSEPGLSGDEIFDYFQRVENRGRISIFHFSGHASEGFLHMAGEGGWPESLGAEGFAGFIREIGGLELIFLNGCNTAGQVDALLQAGVPRVIATTREITDFDARQFAKRFYTGLAERLTVESAFAQARAAFQAKEGGCPWILSTGPNASSDWCPIPLHKPKWAKLLTTMAILIGISMSTLFIRVPTTINGPVHAKSALITTVAGGKAQHLVSGLFDFSSISASPCGAAVLAGRCPNLDSDFNWVEISCERDGHIQMHSQGESRGQLTNLELPPDTNLELNWNAKYSELLMGIAPSPKGTHSLQNDLILEVAFNGEQQNGIVRVSDVRLNANNRFWETGVEQEQCTEVKNISVVGRGGAMGVVLTEPNARFEVSNLRASSIEFYGIGTKLDQQKFLEGASTITDDSSLVRFPELGDGVEAHALLLRPGDDLWIKSSGNLEIDIKINKRTGQLEFYLDGTISDGQRITASTTEQVRLSLFLWLRLKWGLYLVFIAGTLASIGVLIGLAKVRLTR